MKRPPHPSGVLLPRLLACEKRIIPRLCTTVQTCYCGAPLKLRRAVPGPMPPTACLIGDADPCGCLPIRVTLPLCLYASDPCGHTHALPAVIEADTFLPRGWPDGRGTLMIQPEVRLLCQADSCDGHFDVQLHIALELCLVHWGLCGPQAPACPQLPLYPPPICR